jgi:hypothetical protein
MLWLMLWIGAMAFVATYCVHALLWLVRLEEVGVEEQQGPEGSGSGVSEEEFGADAWPGRPPPLGWRLSWGWWTQFMPARWNRIQTVRGVRVRLAIGVVLFVALLIGFVAYLYAHA